jgi:lysine 2,3-aminomutase
VHQLAEYDRELGISYWTKNYRTGIEHADPEALPRRYPYYDPISTLPEAGQTWWNTEPRSRRRGAAQVTTLSAASVRSGVSR